MKQVHETRLPTSFVLPVPDPNSSRESSNPSPQALRALEKQLNQQHAQIGCLPLTQIAFLHPTHSAADGLDAGRFALFDPKHQRLDLTPGGARAPLKVGSHWLVSSQECVGQNFSTEACYQRTRRSSKTWHILAHFPNNAFWDFLTCLGWRR